MADDAPAGRTTTHFGRPAAPTGDGGPPPHRELRPWLWALAYVLVTTLAFSPTLSFRDSPVTAGMVAPRDVVAPRDLIVPDPDATARRRAEASAEVLPVYESDAMAAVRFEEELRAAFDRARPVAARARVRGTVTPELRDAFTLPIGDEALAALARQGFSKELEDRFVAIGLDLYRTGVVDHRDLPPEGRGRGLAVRDSSSGRETRRREAGAVEYGNETKAAVAARLVETPLLGARALRSGGVPRRDPAAEPDLRRQPDGRAPRRGRPLGRERLHADPARQGDRAAGRRDHGARGPVDRGGAGLRLRPVLVGQGDRRPDPADPGRGGVLAGRAAPAAPQARALDVGRVRLGARDGHPVRARDARRVRPGAGAVALARGGLRAP